MSFRGGIMRQATGGQAGVLVREASSLWAGLRHAAVNHPTPDGELPETNALEGSLQSLHSGRGR